MKDLINYFKKRNSFAIKEEKQMPSALNELKEVCNKIVGHWVCEEIPQEFIFDLNDKLLRESRLRIINKKGTFESKYGVAVRPPFSDKTRFYFDIALFDKRYFEIVSLTKDLLILQEFFMSDKPPAQSFIYKRKEYPNQTDQLLKELGLNS